MQIPLFQHAVLPLKKLLLSTILGCWAYCARFYIVPIFMIYKDFIGQKLFRTVVRLRGNDGVIVFRLPLYHRADG